MSYTDTGVGQEIYIDGDLKYNNTRSGYLPEILWSRGQNLSIGGREIPIPSRGVNFNGHVTDVQVFSRKLSREEVNDYTTCSKVKQK